VEPSRSLRRRRRGQSTASAPAPERLARAPLRRPRGEDALEASGHSSPHGRPRARSRSMSSIIS
jgi:hypothetical protein